MVEGQGPGRSGDPHDLTQPLLGPGMLSPPTGAPGKSRAHGAGAHASHLLGSHKRTGGGTWCQTTTRDSHRLSDSAQKPGSASPRTAVQHLYSSKSAGLMWARGASRLRVTPAPHTRRSSSGPQRELPGELQRHLCHCLGPQTLPLQISSSSWLATKR